MIHSHTDTTRLLNASREERQERTDAAPMGHRAAAIEQRAAIDAFIMSHGIKDFTLRTMTPAERVFMEIDMQNEAKRMFTSHYDPLRG